MIRKFCFLFLIMMSLALSGCTLQFEDPNNNTSINQTPVPEIPDPDRYTVFISIKGSTFSPSEINVVNGTTVRWTNEEDKSHKIMFDGVVSPTLKRKDMWNHTFNETGTFKYNCSVHPWESHGLIIVE